MDVGPAVLERRENEKVGDMFTDNSDWHSTRSAYCLGGNTGTIDF
jgi:hypothetical protein